jgi:hypothetical protein
MTHEELKKNYNYTKIIADNLEKLREPTSTNFVDSFNILKKYGINPSEELMKELAQNRWEVIEIAFNQGINAMFDIIDERLRKLGG